MEKFEFRKRNLELDPERVTAERAKIEGEIKSLRTHADDLEKNIDEIAASRASRRIETGKAETNDIESEIKVVRADIESEIKAVRADAEDLERNIDETANSRASHN